MTVTVTEGDPTSLPCHISGNPSTSFSWDKNGVDVLEPQSNRFSLSSNDGTLLISSVEKVDEGVYHCTLTNDLGSASSDVHLRVLGELVRCGHMIWSRVCHMMSTSNPHSACFNSKCNDPSYRGNRGPCIIVV